MGARLGCRFETLASRTRALPRLRCSSGGRERAGAIGGGGTGAAGCCPGGYLRPSQKRRRLRDALVVMVPVQAAFRGCVPPASPSLAMCHLMGPTGEHFAQMEKNKGPRQVDVVGG